ncbi:DUF4412 domain-containing protein [Aquimarina intermedia]|nr:DUF4412 domain-containing protein [Aquimarina intermedia]
MKRSIFITVIFFLIIGTSNGEAQILKRLVKKVKGTLEQKTEEKAEHSINQAIDSLYNYENKKKNKSIAGNGDSINEHTSKSGQQIILNNIINAEKPTIKNTYLFTTKAIFEISDLKKKKSKPMLFTQYYGKMEVLNDFEETNTAMITDFDNKALILLDTKQNTAQIQSLSWMENVLIKSKKQENRDDRFVITKTGKEKMINGYFCFEYVISEEDSKMLAWFAPEVTFNYNDYLSGLNKLLKNNATLDRLTHEKIGYMMEMTLLNKNDEQITKMLVKDVKQVTTKIAMQNFKVIELF